MGASPKTGQGCNKSNDIIKHFIYFFRNKFFQNSLKHRIKHKFERGTFCKFRQKNQNKTFNTMAKTNESTRSLFKIDFYARAINQLKQ